MEVYASDGQPERRGGAKNIRKVLNLQTLDWDFQENISLDRIYKFRIVKLCFENIFVSNSGFM